MRTKKKNKKRLGIKVFFQTLLVFVLLIILGATGLFVYYIKDVPLPEKFTEGTIPQTTRIYDRSGDTLLYELSGKYKRTVAPLKEIPSNLQSAVIAIEDKDFYQHSGFDLEAIGRAILYDIRHGSLTQGGSTITQQLIRTYFLTRQKTLKRKSRELIMAYELDRRHSKSQILEWYLNLIPLGSNIYGVEEAAQTYFGKSVSEINLAEVAIIASLIRSPSYFSPYGKHKEKLLQRKDLVLNLMLGQEHISKEQYQNAKEKEITFSSPETQIKAPHFVFFVKKRLQEKYGKSFLNNNGLKIYTSLDMEIQNKAAKIVKEGVKRLKKYNVYNGALVSMNSNTGEILAMIGSKNWYATSSKGCSKTTDKCKFDPKTNVAVSLRQPGSAIKPFVYAKAFLEGFTPRTTVWDVKTEFNSNCPANAEKEKGKYGSDCYHPENYDGISIGPVTFRQALAQSRNIPSVKVLHLAGVKEALKFCKKMGINSFKNPARFGLALVLGGGEVKLTEMVNGYSVFANNGKKTNINFIRKIENSKGEIIEKSNPTPIKIIPSQIAREINNILSSNKARAPMFGYDSPLKLENYKAAVKTGTTGNYRDAWTIGYTPSLTTGVWVGNNNNSPMAEKASAWLAGKIWNNFMNKTLPNFPKKEFSKSKKRTGKYPALNNSLPGNHSILHYINRADPQYNNWEKAVRNYLN